MIRLKMALVVAIAGLIASGAVVATWCVAALAATPNLGGRDGRPRVGAPRGARRARGKSKKKDEDKEDPSQSVAKLNPLTGESSSDTTSLWLFVSTQDKLDQLVKAGFTTSEIALATGSHRRTVEDRRRRLKNPVLGSSSTRGSDWDIYLDNLFTIYAYLDQQKITADNIRAWLMGRSLYLEEQRPIVLLGAGEFESVREAAIAYSVGERPEDFLEDRPPLPRPLEPTGSNA